MDFTPKFNTKMFRVLLRDLAKHETFNTKQLWEEEKLNRQNHQLARKNEMKNMKNMKDVKNVKNVKNKTHKKKKHEQKLSSKEKILKKIQQNKEKVHVENDMDFIKKSLIINKINMEELKNKISIMKTEKGRQYMKMAFLKEAFKRQDMLNTIDLYIEVGNLPFDNKKDQKILGKIKKKIDKKLGMSIELFQLYKLGERLPPLDFYNKHTFELEIWQKRVLSHIERKNNIFLSAPTSAGKTVIVTNSILATDYRVIILLPTEELALQVTSSIDKFIGKKDKRTYLLWTENYHYSNKLNIRTNSSNSNGFYDSSCEILISTPTIVEQNLHKISSNYDYLIFDEIHCLNYIEIGPSIERIIHYFINCSFLALSATVANVEDLCEWWKTVRPNTNIHIEKYNSRFINLERHIIVDKSLFSLHPLGLIDVEDLKNEENNSLNELAFCPKDLAQCWMSIYSVFGNTKYTKQVPELKELSPDIYFSKFNSYRIILRQTKLYETELKKLLVILAHKFEDETVKLLELFKINASQNEDSAKTSMSQCAKEIHSKKLLPSLFFTSNYSETLNYYKELIHEQETKVDENWPFFREHQLFRKELYDKLVIFEKKTKISREKESNNKTRKSRADQNTENMRELIEDKYRKIIEKEEMSYVNELIELYETTKMKLERDIEELELDNNSSYHKHIVLKNLNTYYKDIYEWKKIPYVSEFERPKELCFYKIALTEEEIADVRRILSNELSMTISTSNILLIGLYYGIGIYVRTLPVGYLRFLQKCAQSRKIGIMLSDRTLSMGISMPFLSVLLYQHNNTEFEQMEAVQMMGRCGRRNRDTTGHLILCNVDPKKLLLKKKTIITGSNIKTPLLGLLPDVKPSFGVLKITKCTIKDNIMKKTTTTTTPKGTSCTTMTVAFSTPALPQYTHMAGNPTDFYTESRKSWVYNTGTTEFTPPIFSRIEKVVIWKSNNCFPYLNELFGELSAYYFVGYMNHKQNRDILNQAHNHILDKSLCYILSSCYFHTLLNEFYQDSSMDTILESFDFYFTHIKEKKFIYNPLEQIISMQKNDRANNLYHKLCEKLKNEKYEINDPLFVHYLYNMVSFIKILSELPYLKGSNIYYSFYRLFMKLRKFLLGSSSGLF